MDQSVSNLNGYATQYEEAATTFVTAFKAAIEAMEGDSKDALDEFFDTKVEDFVTKDLPGAIRGLATLLDSNAKNFDETDAQVAASIRGN
jgi:hypothetical protein